jgi:hypothetical protein
MMPYISNKKSINTNIQMQDNQPNLKLRVQKMDQRFAASECFQYRVSVSPDLKQIYVRDVDRILAFNQFRQWCIDALGMSYERDSYVKLHFERLYQASEQIAINPNWAWYCHDHKIPYFYFTESGMSWVQIKWL